MRYSGRRAIVDLDDTLGGLRYVLMDVMKEKTGLYVHWSEWNILSMEAIYGMTNEQFLDIAYHEKLLEKSRPHPEASSFMKRLSDAGLEIIILTARSWHPRAKRMTENWLELYDIPYDEVIVTSLEDDKSDYIRHMDNVLLTIDDSTRHCNGYARLQNRPEFVFAYSMPWNEDDLDESVIRVCSLENIYNHIEGL